MNFDEYRQMDGVALAAAVANKEVTASELLEVAIKRAEEVNPELNGLIIPLYEEARAVAKAPMAGPLAGVPMLAKDFYQEMAGAPHYMGSKGLKRINNIAAEDSELVKRWRQAGLVIFGRTNTPEFAAKGITEPEAWGASRNPWNTEHTPGGSSGGSAALVAAGVVPFAGANDGGGSIRIPAACCGLFGLKPGRGRVPWGPHMQEAMHGMAINHVVTRSVRDSAAILDATHGNELGSLVNIAAPSGSYLDATKQNTPTLRIAYSTRSPIGSEVDIEAIKAVEKTVKLLTDLGHHVEEAEPNIDGEQMMIEWLRMWFANCAVTAAHARSVGANRASDMEIDTQVMAAVGDSMKAVDYVRGYYEVQKYGYIWDQFMLKYDFWLTPSLGMAPAKIGAMETPAFEKFGAKLALTLKAGAIIRHTGMLEKVAQENLKYTPFTQLANVIGVPGMSVPLHWCDNGLPLGVQFVGTHGDEAKLLNLAGQLEQAQPWFGRIPQ